MSMMSANERGAASKPGDGDERGRRRLEEREARLVELRRLREQLRGADRDEEKQT